MGTVTLKQPKNLKVPELDDPRVRRQLWIEAEKAARADQRRNLAMKGYSKG